MTNIENDAKQLWELSTRLGYAASLYGRRLTLRGDDALQIDHAIHTETLSMYMNMLLRVSGGLGGFSPVKKVSRAAAEADRTTRGTVSNVKRELNFLKISKPAEQASVDAAFFYLRALQVAYEAVDFGNAAVNNQNLLLVSTVVEKLDRLRSTPKLQEAYLAAVSTGKDVFLMSFVDHLLIFAKAIFEIPVEGEKKFLSNWAEMQDNERSNANQVTPPKAVNYQCGLVDMAAVSSAVIEKVSESLPVDDEEPAEPIAAMLYALTLLELAAEIVTKVAEDA